MTIAYVAAVTKNIRLLTSVMVLPHRAPVLAAKMLATADVLSKGRLTGGVGVGWMAEEIGVLGAMPFSKRAAGAEEYISAFRNLWTQQTSSFHGDLVDFENILFDPKPEQKPHPPIWMGGESKPALDRTGRLADGWYPVIANPRHLLDSPSLYGTMLSQVKGLVQRAGRPPDALDTALYAPWYQLGKPIPGRDGDRRPFTGNAEQIAQDAQGYGEAGLNHLVIGFESHDLNQSLERIERFATEVMPLCS
jgi:probable F420-dependent oxidoreductase